MATLGSQNDEELALQEIDYYCCERRGNMCGVASTYLEEGIE
jgi:hypothetical protein